MTGAKRTQLFSDAQPLDPLPEGPRKGGRNDLSNPGERPAPPPPFRPNATPSEIFIAEALGKLKEHGRMLTALGLIARGRADCGRALAAEDARQLARDALDELGLRWPGGNQRKR